MLAFLAAAALLLPPAGDCEYFPLRPGMTWEYAVTFEGGLLRVTQVHKTLDHVTIGTQRAVPMNAYVNGELSRASYYRVSEEFVLLVADNSAEPLPAPIPILPVRPKQGQRWGFRGQLVMFGSLVTATIKSRVVGIEEIDVLGSKVRGARVVRDTQLGSGPTALKTSTKELYAAGVGLVSSRHETKTETAGTATFTLVRFHGGGR